MKVIYESYFTSRIYNILFSYSLTGSASVYRHTHLTEQDLHLSYKTAYQLSKKT